MFRKPKRKAKASLRRKDDDGGAAAAAAAAAATDAAKDDGEGNGDGDDETNELLSEARKRSKAAGAGVASSSSETAAVASEIGTTKKNIMHSYEASEGAPGVTAADLATSTNQYHPEHLLGSKKKEEAGSGGGGDDAAASGGGGGGGGEGTAGRGKDGIFRDKQRNKFLAGPIRAAANIRVTARFDYQPDICKDYKDTGFCGFGDTCIYLHDRGDTLSGWQLERQWEEQQKQKKAKQEKEMQDFISSSAAGGGGGEGGVQRSSDASAVAVTADDGLPFACHLCRDYFKDPVVTACGHYFCERCIMDRVRTVDEACPICGKDTSSVFNQPAKLIAKKRQVVGRKATWEEYAAAFKSGGRAGTADDEEG